MKRTMTCRDGVRLLMDYTEGALSATHRMAVEAHVSGCVRCRGFVRSYRETPRILREATARPMPVRLGRRLRRTMAAVTARSSPFRGGRSRR